MLYYVITAPHKIKKDLLTLNVLKKFSKKHEKVFAFYAIALHQNRKDD